VTKTKLTAQEHRLRQYILALKDLQTQINSELENFSGDKDSFDLAIAESSPPLRSIPDTALRAIRENERYAGFLEAQVGKQ
jgi:hypothetical protein